MYIFINKKSQKVYQLEHTCYNLKYYEPAVVISLNELNEVTRLNNKLSAMSCHHGDFPFLVRELNQAITNLRLVGEIPALCSVCKGIGVEDSTDLYDRSCSACHGSGLAEGGCFGEPE